ncbi:MAG TPA: histidine kinase N-terminal 7TM domain-containing protein, partial [Sphingobacteriaceae bacterium]
MSFNYISVVLILSGVLALVISLFLLGNKKSVARLCGMMMSATGIWGITYGMQFTTSSFDQIMFWTYLEYVGIAVLPPLWLIFTITYAGKEKFLTRNRILALFLVPIATVVMVSTNEYHHLHYRSLILNTSGPLPVIEFEAGIWYWIFMGYFYVMLLIGAYLMIEKYRKSDAIFRKQNNIILLGAFLPVVFNVFYQAGYRPAGLKIDITPFGFIISSVVVAFGLIRYQLFNIVPIARDKIIEAMAEGIMVTDTLGRVVDVNPAMQKLLAPYTSQPIGLGLSELLPQLQLPENRFDPYGHHKLEINKNAEGVNRAFSVTITPIFDNDTYTGRIFVCKDVTEQREYAEKLESLNKLKDKLFSIISHDLRSPLISLLDLLSLNNQGMLSDEELRDFLPQLQKNVGYTSSLLENLLQWSKSQLQNAVTRPVQIDLH